MSFAKPVNSSSSRTVLYILLVIGMAVFNYTVSHRFDDIPVQYSNKIFDRNGIFIGYTYASSVYDKAIRERTVPVGEFENVPPMLLRILSSMEDKQMKNDFQNRLGFRFKGLGRAVLFLGSRGGGSGVFQQLVKNLFLKNEGGFNRKITEMQVASAMYLNYKLEDIVILYLNNVSFGNNIRGFAAASRFFYNKSLKECTIPQLGMLVGMLNGPNNYYNASDIKKNRLKNKKAVERKKQVMAELLEDGIISKKEYAAYAAQPVRFVFNKSMTNVKTEKTQQFNSYVEAEFIKICRVQKFDSNATDLNIYTCFDIRAQEAAERVIRNYWNNEFSPAMKNAQVAFVSLDPRTSGILCMVGGNPNAAITGLNRATTLFKPVGSAFKPFFYAAMFEKGYSLNYTLPDKELRSDWAWKVHNYDNKVSGTDMPLLDCITYSRNIPVCYAMNTGIVTANDIKNLAARCGVTATLPNSRMIAIGGQTEGVSPLQLANAYATFSNQGMYIPVHAIDKIVKTIKGKKAEKIFEYYPLAERKQALSPAAYTQLRECLESVVNRGTASSVRRYYKGYAAGKTGTSDNNKDAWFGGFTQQAASAVWVGFDESTTSLPAPFNQGGRVAAPIWAQWLNEWKP